MKLKHFLPILMIAGAAAAESGTLAEYTQKVVLKRDTAKTLNPSFGEVHFGMWDKFSKGGNISEAQKDTMVTMAYNKWLKLFKDKEESGITFLSVWAEAYVKGLYENTACTESNYVGEVVLRPLVKGDPTKLRTGVVLSQDDEADINKAFLKSANNWIAENMPKAKELYIVVPAGGFPVLEDILRQNSYTETDVDMSTQPDMQNLPKGLWLLSIHTKEGVVVKRIVKSN